MFVISKYPHRFATKEYPDTLWWQIRMSSSGKLRWSFDEVLIVFDPGANLTMPFIKLLLNSLLSIMTLWRTGKQLNSPLPVLGLGVIIIVSSLGKNWASPS